MDTKKRISHKPLLTVITAALLTIFFTQLIALWLLRLHTLQLTGELNYLEGRIKSYSVEDAELKQAISKTASPITIYDYCKRKLNMDKALNVNVIHTPRAATAARQSDEGWRSNLSSFLGLKIN